MTQFAFVHKVYNDNSKKIEELIQKSKFPKTHQALKNLYLIIHDIMKALEEIEKIQGFYASQGLSRILYEHFLVAYYIFTKCRIDKDDSCGGDYIDYYPIYEMIKRENYNTKLDKTYDATKRPLQNFLIAAPDLMTWTTPLPKLII